MAMFKTGQRIVVAANPIKIGNFVVDAQDWIGTIVQVSELPSLLRPGEIFVRYAIKPDGKGTVVEGILEHRLSLPIPGYHKT